MNFGGAPTQPLTTYIKGQVGEKEQKSHPGKEQDDARSEKSGSKTACHLGQVGGSSRSQPRRVLSSEPHFSFAW